MTVYSSTLQKEVDDVWEPQQVEHAGDAEEHCGIALVRARRFSWVSFLRAKSCPPLADLSGVLPAYPENVGVCEAHNDRCRCVQCSHNEGSEEWLGEPERRAPLKDITMIPRLAPAKERRQED